MIKNFFVVVQIDGEISAVLNLRDPISVLGYAYNWLQKIRTVSRPRDPSVLLDYLRGLQLATEALAQWYGHNAFKYSDKIVVFIGNQSTQKASNMQVPNHIHSRHWIAQKPSSASKKRLEVSRTGKQRPDKAQNLDVLVEISAKQPELINEFENAFYKAIQIRR